MCLSGILLFGMGRSLAWWCIVVFIGCFGSPVYQTYQTVLFRERVPVSLQGRIFSLQGMITSGLTPLGCLAGAAGIVICILVSRNPGIRELEDEN